MLDVTSSDSCFDSVCCNLSREAKTLKVLSDEMKNISRGMTSYASTFGFMRGVPDGGGQELPPHLSVGEARQTNQSPPSHPELHRHGDLSMRVERSLDFRAAVMNARPKIKTVAFARCHMALAVPS